MSVQFLLSGLNFPKWILISRWTEPRCPLKVGVSQGSRRRMLIPEEQKRVKEKAYPPPPNFPHLWDSSWNLEVILKEKLSVWFPEGSGRPGVSCEGLVQSTLPGWGRCYGWENVLGLDYCGWEATQPPWRRVVLNPQKKCQFAMPPTLLPKVDISGLWAFSRLFYKTKR